MKDYRILNEKDKERIFGIKSFLIYGYFVKRNYSRDLDIVIFERMKENKLNEIASSLEKKVGMEVDLRIFDELPEPIKFLALTQGKGNIEGKFRRKAFDFLRVYIDFVEWLRKWS